MALYGLCAIVQYCFACVLYSSIFAPQFLRQMANLKEVRIRIASVNTTQQITKAMKLVAASKLKRAQDRILQMRPYSEKLNEILSNIMSNLEGGTFA